MIFSSPEFIFFIFTFACVVSLLKNIRSQLAMSALFSCAFIFFGEGLWVFAYVGLAYLAWIGGKVQSRYFKIILLVILVFSLLGTKYMEFIFGWSGFLTDR